MLPEEKNTDPPLDYTSPSVIAIFLANAVPLFGVLFLGWEIFPIMALYWAENVIIGILNVVKMATCQGPLGSAPKAFFIPFFIVHYGIFTMVHGMFVLTLFGGGGMSFGGPSSMPAAMGAELGSGMFLVLAGLFASHAFSMAVNYYGRGEYRNTALPILMFAPYPRVVVLHVTIIFGGFVTMFLGAPVLAVALLVILKTGLDVKLHLREHNKAGLPANWEHLAKALNQSMAGQQNHNDDNGPISR